MALNVSIAVFIKIFICSRSLVKAFPHALTVKLIVPSLWLDVSKLQHTSSMYLRQTNSAHQTMLIRWATILAPCTQQPQVAQIAQRALIRNKKSVISV